MKFFIVMLALSAPIFLSAKSKNTIVTFDTIKKTELAKSLTYPVEIKSKLESQILSDNNYIVIDILVGLGQQVKKGTPLLKLRNQDVSVHYQNRVYKSPVDGTVAQIQAGKGEFISKGKPLILLNDPANLYGRINIPSNDFSKIQKGLKGELSISSLGIKKLEIKVQGKGSSVNKLTGTIPVDIELSNPKGLIPGIIGNATLLLSKTSKILVKEKSIFYVGEDTFLATVDDKNKVKKVKVTLGQRYKENIELVEGLEEGTKFVAETPKFLRDGEIVASKEDSKSKSEK